MSSSDLLTIPQLGKELERLELELRTCVEHDHPVLAQVAQHLVSAGGKRIRPSLTIAAAIAGQAEVTKEVLLGGVAVELVHLASLHHDDVMDEADSRRGVPSVNARWGNLVAVVTGDFLLAKAAGVAARLGTEIAELLADTLGAMCEGQILEVSSAFDPRRTEEEYFRAIEGKTASLMATATRIGAIVSGQGRTDIEKLTELGQSLGMIFQIRDDVLDIAASEADLGKAPGQDLVEGIYTLPIILGLQNPMSNESVMEYLQGDTKRDDLPRLMDTLRSSGAIAGTYEFAVKYEQRCQAIASEISTPMVHQLADLASRFVSTLDPFLKSSTSAI